MKKTKGTSKKQSKVRKGFAVLCSKRSQWRVFEKKASAKRHADFLDEEYSGYCEHSIVPVTITYKV